MLLILLHCGGGGGGVASAVKGAIFLPLPMDRRITIDDR